MTQAGSRTRGDGVVGPWQRYGWLMAVVWMGFLFYPALSLAQSATPSFLRALGWCGLVLFATAYVTGFVIGMRESWARASPRVLALFFVAVLCAAVTIPAIGWEATGFLPFLMAYASYGLRGSWHWAVAGAGLGIILTQVVVAVVFGGEPSWVLLGVIVMMTLVNTINVWLISRSVATDELRLDLATSEERESVARDVHDLIGHSLTVVKLKAELASRLVDRDPDAARSELEEIARLAGEAISGVRSTVTGLRSSGFAEQLGESRAVLEDAGIAVAVAGDAAALSAAQSLTAGWILREATTNILRHAAAGRVRIEIAPGTVVIEDDGVGIGAKPGNGIRGMAERAAAGGGALSVERGSGTGIGGGPCGTRVSVTW